MLDEGWLFISFGRMGVRRVAPTPRIRRDEES